MQFPTFISPHFELIKFLWYMTGASLVVGKIVFVAADSTTAVEV